MHHSGFINIHGPIEPQANMVDCLKDEFKETVFAQFFTDTLDLE